MPSRARTPKDRHENALTSPFDTNCANSCCASMVHPLENRLPTRRSTVLKLKLAYTLLELRTSSHAAMKNSATAAHCKERTDYRTERFLPTSESASMPSRISNSGSPSHSSCRRYCRHRKGRASRRRKSQSEPFSSQTGIRFLRQGAKPIPKPQGSPSDKWNRPLARGRSPPHCQTAC